MSKKKLKKQRKDYTYIFGRKLFFDYNTTFKLGPVYWTFSLDALLIPSRSVKSESSLWLEDGYVVIAQRGATKKIQTGWSSDSEVIGQGKTPDQAAKNCENGVVKFLEKQYKQSEKEYKAAFLAKANMKYERQQRIKWF